MANASKASEVPEVSFLGSFVQRLLFTRRERLVHHSQQQQQHEEEYEVGNNRRLSSPTPEPIEDVVGHSSASTSSTTTDNEGNVAGGQNIYGNIRSTSETIVKKEEEKEDGEYNEDVSDVMEFSEDEDIDVKEEDDEEFEDAAMDVDHYEPSGPEVNSGHTTDDNGSEEVENRQQQQPRNNEANNSTTSVIAPEENGSVNGADICADNGSGPEDNQTIPEDQHSSTDVDGTAAITTCVNNLEHNEQQGSGAEIIIPNPTEYKPEMTGSSGNSADNSSGHQDSEDIPEDHHSSTVDGTFTIPDPNKEGNGDSCSELIMPNHNEDKPATGSEDIADNNGPDGEEEDSGDEIEISPDEPSSQLSVIFEASLGLPLFNSCRQNDNNNSALPGDQSDGTFYSCENNASIGGDQSRNNTPNSDVYYSCEENNNGAHNRNLFNIEQLLAQAQAAQSSPALTDESIVVQPDIYSEEEGGRSSVELSEDSVCQLYNDYYKPRSLNGARLDSSGNRGSNINNNRPTSASPIINDKSPNSSRPSSSSASSTTIVLGQEVGQNVATEEPSLPSEGGDEDDDDEPRAKVRKPNKRGMRRPGESQQAYEKRMKLNDYMRNYQRNKKLTMAAQAHNAGGRKA